MKDINGFSGQIYAPYQSTIAFEKFLTTRGCFVDETEILDIGTGYGGILHYFKRLHSRVRFLGVDYNQVNIDESNKYLNKSGLTGVAFEYGDWFNLPDRYISRFDGIINVHTLCCFKHIEPAIESLVKLNTRWLAFKSLFYEGPLDVLIHIRDYNRPDIADDNPDGDFNIFSMQKTMKAFEGFGYEVSFEPFYPSAAIPKKPNGERGTYTRITELSEYTQFSGPVHLPWYFICAQKK